MATRHEEVFRTTVDVGGEERQVEVHYLLEVSFDSSSYGSAFSSEMRVELEINEILLDGAQVTQGALTSLIGEEEWRRIERGVKDG